MNKKVQKTLLIYENHVYAKCSYVYSCHISYDIHTYYIHVQYACTFFLSIIKGWLCTYTYIVYVCIVQCILFVPSYIWNKSCLWRLLEILETPSSRNSTVFTPCLTIWMYSKLYVRNSWAKYQPSNFDIFVYDKNYL